MSALLSPEVPKLNSERRDPGWVSIIENTQIQRIRNTFVIFYSVGDYVLPNYKIGLAYSKSLLGPCACAALLPASDTCLTTRSRCCRLKGLHERYGQRLEQYSADARGAVPHAVVGAVLARLHEPIPVRAGHREPGQHDVQRTRAVVSARHPNNQGARYLWKYSYLSLKPGVWDLDSGSLAGLITLGGACAPPYNDSLSRCKFMNKSVAGTEVAWHRPYEYQ